MEWDVARDVTGPNEFERNAKKNGHSRVAFTVVYVFSLSLSLELLFLRSNTISCHADMSLMERMRLLWMKACPFLHGTTANIDLISSVWSYCSIILIAICQITLSSPDIQCAHKDSIIIYYLDVKWWAMKRNCCLCNSPVFGVNAVYAVCVCVRSEEMGREMKWRARTSQFRSERKQWI